MTDPSAPGGLRLADDLPQPTPEPGEVLIEVGAAAINRGELFLLQQRPEGWRPGQDVAGVVRQGPADGGGPRPGDRVVAVVDGGGWAELVTAPIHRLAPLPRTVGLEQAAALPIAGLTALRALRLGGSLLGRRVLVTGATGGVGQFAIQLGRAAGARVTALVSGPDREEEARGLGAHEVVLDLDEPGIGPFALVLDAIGGETLRAAVHRLAPSGTAALYGVLGGPAELGLGDFAGAPGARVVGLFHSDPEDRREDLATLAGLVADGTLTPRIGMVRDWEELRAALDALRERRVRGKAVVTIG